MVKRRFSIVLVCSVVKVKQTTKVVDNQGDANRNKGTSFSTLLF